MENEESKIIEVDSLELDSKVKLFTASLLIDFDFTWKPNFKMYAEANISINRPFLCQIIDFIIRKRDFREFLKWLWASVGSYWWTRSWGVGLWLDFAKTFDFTPKSNG